MLSTLTMDQQYRDWLREVKHKVRNAQIKAAVRVNRELLTLYWELGAEIVEKQAATKWGDGFLLQVSKDLRAEFPEMKGFSNSNLKFIKQWYSFYSQVAISQQLVSQNEQSSARPLQMEIFAQITQIPWGHNIVIISKCKNVEEALYVDDQLRSAPDQPTIGILICKDKNKTIAEYALRDIHKPIGVSEYQLTQSLPDDLKSRLPSIEEIERELESIAETPIDLEQA